MSLVVGWIPIIFRQTKYCTGKQSVLWQTICCLQDKRSDVPNSIKNSARNPLTNE